MVKFLILLVSNFLCSYDLGKVFASNIDGLVLVLFVKKFSVFFFFFLATLGLHCCTRAFSSCGEWGLLLIAVHGLLTVVASLVAEHGL